MIFFNNEAMSHCLLLLPGLRMVLILEKARELMGWSQNNSLTLRKGVGCYEHPEFTDTSALSGNINPFIYE